MVTAVQHILAESLKQSNEVQKFVTSNIQLLDQMDMLLEKYSTQQELSNEQLYEMALAIRAIGPNYGSVSLLKASLDHVNTGAELSTLMSKY